MTRRCPSILWAWAVLALLPARAAAQAPADKLPPALRDVGIDQHVNESVPADLTFKDETGREVRLGDYFGRKPVILVLAYFRCPMLCSMVLNNLTETMQKMKFQIGNQFDVVTVSFDPRETPAMAAAKKQNYANHYGRPGAVGGWHFLTGNQETIDRLTRAVGFRYAYDAAKDQFAHASGFMVLTPEGKLFRYFYGVDYSSRDLHLSLIEASSNKAGSLVDQVLLFCYGYDPHAGRYTANIMRIVRVACVGMVVGVASLVGFLWRRGARRRVGAEG
jgi:protein SCO1/2